MTDSSKSSESAKLTDDEALKEKQEMVEKLFRHTNGFLQEHKQDPLLIVEALAAILVRYAALLGPVEQMADRLSVLEALVGQECTQIQEIAKATAAENADKS
jgi:hypothetical protein